MYNKVGFSLRMETTINSRKSLGLIEDFMRCKKDVEASLDLAYEAFKKANMLLGKKGVEKAAPSAVSCENIHLKD